MSTYVTIVIKYDEGREPPYEDIIESIKRLSDRCELLSFEKESPLQTLYRTKAELEEAKSIAWDKSFVENDLKNACELLRTISVLELSGLIQSNCSSVELDVLCEDIRALLGKQLKKSLKVGSVIKIGKIYADQSRGRFKEGEEITLIEGYFEHDNGLYTETVTAPSIPVSGEYDDFDSIYHLFGNELDNFLDCEIIPSQPNESSEE